MTFGFIPVIIISIISIVELTAGVLAVLWGVRTSRSNKRRGIGWAWGLGGLLIIVVVPLNVYISSVESSKHVSQAGLSASETLRAFVSGMVGGIFLTLALLGELSPSKAGSKGENSSNDQRHRS